MNDSETPLHAFTLGAHRIELCARADQTLSLRVDGITRKQRGGGGGPAWLWTNVELPFEDHHLVEVRRDGTGRLDLRVNNTPLDVFLAEQR